MAKALRDFARANPNLVVKGGMVGTGVLSAADINVLADLPSRDTLLAQFAGALSAPLQQLAGLVQALPRNLAYGLSALIDQRQASGEVAEPAAGGRGRSAGRSRRPPKPSRRSRSTPRPQRAEAEHAEAHSADRPRPRRTRRAEQPPRRRQPRAPDRPATDRITAQHPHTTDRTRTTGNKEQRQWQAP